MTRTSGDWWASVIHEFKMHVREEAVFLEAYERLVEESDDESVRFLIQLVLADEHRHHELFQSMADSAVGAAEGVPPAPTVSPDAARRLLEPTERFLEAEREDSAKLAALRRELKPVRDATLWSLLVELMEIDTSKHVRILEYLRGRLRAAAAG